MDAPTELMVRAKELVRSLCARNLIPGADLALLTLAIHDELCGASLAMLAELALRKDHVCRGNLEVAIRSTGYELMVHLQERHNLKEEMPEVDPVIRTRMPVKTDCPIGLRSCPLHVALAQSLVKGREFVVDTGAQVELVSPPLSESAV